MDNGGLRVNPTDKEYSKTIASEKQLLQGHHKNARKVNGISRTRMVVTIE
jgi:hypothetical protein